MVQSKEKGLGASRILIWLAFTAVGAATLADPFNKLNPYHIGLGILLGLLSAFLYPRFMSLFLGLLNRDYKAEHGRKSIRRLVSKGEFFLIPFAVMLCLATFLLNWPMTIAFVSAGFMAMGTAAAMEIGLARGRTSIGNTLAATLVSFGFSLIWTLGYPFLIKAPYYLEGGVNLIRSIIGGGLGS